MKIVFCAALAFIALAVASAVDLLPAPSGVNAPGLEFNATNTVYTADGLTLTANIQTGLDIRCGPGLTVVGWDKTTDSRVVGFNLYFCPVGSTNRTRISMGANVTCAMLFNLPTNAIHCIWATSFDAYGNESGPSKVLVWKPQ